MAIESLVDARRNGWSWFDGRKIECDFKSMIVSFEDVCQSPEIIPVARNIGTSIEPSNLFLSFEGTCMKSGLCKQ
jgi:hypothetical protein